jgi:hypothetical protein
MRPQYETTADRVRELSVVDAYSKATGWTFNKVPAHYRVDGCFTDKNGNLAAWVEVKNRTCSKGTYPTYLISLNKVREGLALAKDTGVPFVLLVKWTDGCFELPIAELPLSIRVGGRSDRNDWQDQEPVCFFDINSFRQIAT